MLQKDSATSIKDNVKELSKEEIAIKSISFSIPKDEQQITIYFTWKKEEYSKFHKERNIFRNVVRDYIQAQNYKLNIKDSTPAKYIFDKIKLYG